MLANTGAGVHTKRSQYRFSLWMIFTRIQAGATITSPTGLPEAAKPLSFASARQVRILGFPDWHDGGNCFDAEDYESFGDREAVAMVVFDLGVILQCDDKAKVLVYLSEKIFDEYNHEMAARATQGVTCESVSLRSIDDCLKLLEISIYIQYYDFFSSQGGRDGWLKLFFEGRRNRIVSDGPYLRG